MVKVHILLRQMNLIHTLSKYANLLAPRLLESIMFLRLRETKLEGKIIFLNREVCLYWKLTQFPQGKSRSG